MDEGWPREAESDAKAQVRQFVLTGGVVRSPSVGGEPVVADLIDLGSSEGDDCPTPPAARSPTTPRASMVSRTERSFEGVANGLGRSSLRGSPAAADADHQPRTSPLHFGPVANGQSNFVRGRPSSSNAIAAQLLQQARQAVPNGMSGLSRRSSIGSDADSMSVSDVELHSEISEISCQVSSIHRKLAALEEQNYGNDDKQARLKADNAVLLERVHYLEEQLQQSEERWKEKLTEEKQRNSDLQKRLEREKSLELESSSLKFQVLEKDHKQCSAEREKLLFELETLNGEVDRLTEELDDEQQRVQQADMERLEVQRQMRRHRDESDAELAGTIELVDELSRQNDQLRMSESRRRVPSIVDKAVDLEEEVERLRDSERKLRDERDELNAQLLAASVEQGRFVLSSTARGTSLMDEIRGKDKDELMNALKEAEMCNTKLRSYIDGILMRVIEKYPEILEIQDSAL